MTEFNDNTSAYEAKRVRSHLESENIVEDHSPTNEVGELHRAVGTISREVRSTRSNAAARAASLRTLQSTYGNRAVQRYLCSSTTVSRPHLSVSVQREEEGGMWDYAKKLIGVDQIGPGIENIVGKAKSGYEWAEKGILDFLGGGGSKSAGKGASEPEPSAGYPPDRFEPYLQFEVQDAMISSYSL